MRRVGSCSVRTYVLSLSNSLLDTHDLHSFMQDAFTLRSDTRPLYPRLHQANKRLDIRYAIPCPNCLLACITDRLPSHAGILAIPLLALWVLRLMCHTYSFLFNHIQATNTISRQVSHILSQFLMCRISCLNHQQNGLHSKSTAFQINNFKLSFNETPKH